MSLPISKTIPYTFRVGDQVTIKMFSNKKGRQKITYIVCRANYDKEYPYGIIADHGTLYFFKAYELKKV